MNLTELLAELREGILNDRTDRTSGTSDYLWSDTRLVRYIDEAHRRFATQGLVIRDANTAEVCQVKLVAGQTEYPLHEAIIAVVSAKLSTASADLTRVGHALFAMSQPATDQWFDTSTYTSLPPGNPVAYSTDEGVSDYATDSVSQVLMRIYPAPDTATAGKIVKLRVVRKPLADFTTRSMGAIPEIPVDHHLEMLDWAAYLALRIVDDDAGSPKRAQEFASSFQVHVTNARKLAMKKMFAPQPWGFGRGGFSWGS